MPPSGVSGTELLAGSPLFDTDWYALQSGLSATDRVGCARHYLSEGAQRRLSPHPLVDPDHLARVSRRRFPQDQDPFVVYLRRRAWRTPTHPLLDVRSYLRRYPEAVDHPSGPLGHFDEIGAPAGHPPTTWWPVDAQGRTDDDVRRWIRDRWE